MGRHRGEGQASNEGRDHHTGRHRSGQQTEPGFPVSGRISDRIRSTPELMALEQQPADRGESSGPYDR